MKKEESLREISGLPEDVLEELLKTWNPIIRIDRTIRSTYSELIRVKYPRLERKGPTEFDVRALEGWVHPQQQSGVSGNEVLKKLIAKKLLRRCLNLDDLRAIQARGRVFFRKYFLGQAIFAWKSIGIDRNGYEKVPFILDNNGKNLEVNWLNIEDELFSFDVNVLHVA